MSSYSLIERAWPDMCAAYRDAKLGASCLAMQQAFAVDVPLLLVLCLADRAGRTMLPADLKRLVADAGAWRETVVVPLRGVRQAMKHRFDAPDAEALRDNIKRLEFEAERLHVVRLVEAYPEQAADGDPAAPAYLAACGVTAEAAQDFIEIFAAAHAAQVSQNPLKARA